MWICELAAGNWRLATGGWLLAAGLVSLRVELFTIAFYVEIINRV
jgi:hypothetical protein